MNQYIDKDALLAKIERRLEALANTSTGDNREFAVIIGAQYYELKSLVQYINTLEVKEVDLEKEIKDYFDSQPIITRSKGVDYRLIPTGVDIARHFFELGLKAQKGE